jgi:beta-mannosidase
MKPQRRDESTSLAGQWSYVPDPDGTLSVEDLDGREWDNMDLPTNWEFGGLENYDGVVWFRRSFEWDPSGSPTWLRFGGVDYFADVWLDGTHLGDHEGYFEPFEFEVSDALDTGSEHDLLVRVDSPREDPETIWPDEKRLIKGILQHWDGRPGSWDPEYGQDMNTGGIWNDIVIYETEPVRVRDASYTPVLLDDGSAVVRTTATVQNRTGGAVEASLSARVEPVKDVDGDSDGDGEASAARDRNVRLDPGTSKIELALHVADPKLWWTWDMGDQHLYEGFVSVTVDGQATSEWSDQFGIRDLSIEDPGEEWRLNGEPFYPRGSNHIPTLWLSEYTDDLIAEDLSLMREANLNAMRVCVHVTHPDFYRAADEAGILLWQDFPLQWSYGESPAFYEEAGRQLEDMVDLLYNHPSVGVWCCHNEPSVNTGTLDHILSQRAREADATRYVEHHSDFHDHTYPGWYYDHYREYSSLPGAPFVNEFGAQALPDADYLREFLGVAAWPPDWDRWTYHDFQYDQTFNVADVEMGDSLEEFVANSQRYQYDLVKFAIEQYRRARDETTGLFHFMFTDCWPAITWSVLDDRREPKEGFHALRKACQPVLPTIDVGRHRHVAADDGRSLFRDVVVVNDRPDDIEDATVRLRLQGDGEPVIEDEYAADLPANEATTVLELEHSDATWEVTGDVEPGDYELVADVIVDGEQVARNDERITVVEAVAAQKIEL